MKDLGVGLKWWWDDSEKMMRKNYFDENNDDKKLDKGDFPTLRIIYI